MAKSIPHSYQSHFEQNLSYIRESNPVLYRKVRASSPEKYLKVTLEGNLTLKLQGLWVESQYNPEREIIRYSNLDAKDPTMFPLFIGGGLGYHINALQKNRERRAVLIEREVDIFRASLYVIEPDILRNLIPLVGLETRALEKKILGLVVKKPLIIEHSRSIQFHRDYYASVIDLITTRMRESVASTLTGEATMKLWIKNVLRNLVHLKGSSYDTRELYGQFRGPVLLVSSGPYLVEIVSQLKRWSKFIPVFALLPSLPFLLKNNMCPDFVVTSDANFWNRYRLVRGCTIPLFTTYSVDRGLLRNWAGETYLFSHGLPIEEQFDAIKQWSLVIPMQGTASLVMILLARQLGFTDIFLAGYDFAYRGIEDHHRGAGFDRLLLSMSTRIQSWQTLRFQRLRSDRILEVRDHFGHEILSSHKLSLYKSWFEREIAHGDIRRLNNGAYIKGLKLMEGGEMEGYGNWVKEDFLKSKLSLKRTVIQKRRITDELKGMQERVKRLYKESPREVYELFFGPIPEYQREKNLLSSLQFVVDEFRKIDRLVRSQ